MDALTGSPTDAVPPDDLACASCGTLLGFDDEDDPEGEAGLPLCGECNRARNFDAMLEFMGDR